MAKVLVQNVQCTFLDDCVCDECTEDREAFRKAGKRKDPRENQMQALQSVGGRPDRKD